MPCALWLIIYLFEGKGQTLTPINASTGESARALFARPCAEFNCLLFCCWGI